MKSTKTNDNALHDLASTDDLERLKETLNSTNYKQNPNLISDQDNCGRTPLHLAAMMGYKKHVELLLKAGANPDIKDRYGNKAIHYADQKEIIDLIKKHKYNLFTQRNLDINQNVKNKLKALLENPSQQPFDKSTSSPPKSLAGRMASLTKRIGKTLGRKTDNELVAELHKKYQEYMKSDKSAKIEKVKRWSFPSFSLPFFSAKSQGSGERSR